MKETTVVTAVTELNGRNKTAFKAPTYVKLSSLTTEYNPEHSMRRSINGSPSLMAGGDAAALDFQPPCTLMLSTGEQ